MAYLILKTAPHARAAVHRVVTVQPVANAVNVQNALKATSARMTTLKHARKVAPRSAVKAAIHAMNAGMIAAHAVTTLAKLG